MVKRGKYQRYRCLDCGTVYPLGLDVDVPVYDGGGRLLSHGPGCTGQEWENFEEELRREEDKDNGAS